MATNSYGLVIPEMNATYEPVILFNRGIFGVGTGTFNVYDPKTKQRIGGIYKGESFIYIGIGKNGYSVIKFAKGGSLLTGVFNNSEASFEFWHRKLHGYKYGYGYLKTYNRNISLYGKTISAGTAVFPAMISGHDIYPNLAYTGEYVCTVPLQSSNDFDIIALHGVDYGGTRITSPQPDRCKPWAESEYLKLNLAAKGGKNLDIEGYW